MALVALGEMELNMLARPRSALRRFDAYLAGGQGGPLAQEALFGKTRAHRALGDARGEQRALESFLTRFPKAVQAHAVRERLSQIKGQ